MNLIYMFEITFSETIFFYPTHKKLSDITAAYINLMVSFHFGHLLHTMQIYAN